MKYEGVEESPLSVVKGQKREKKINEIEKKMKSMKPELVL